MSTPGPPKGGDQSKAPMLRGVLSSELAVATIIVTLRFFTRLKLTRNPGWDDWIMLGTFTCAVIGTTMDLVGMNYGIGRHVYYLQPNDAVLATKLDWLCQAFVITALTTGKVSVAFFILRLSNTKWHFYLLHSINITLGFINVPLIIWTYAQCRPSALLWDPTLPGKCQDPKMQGSFAIFQGSYGAATDLLYALFPIVIIWPLQMPRRRKILLASIMALGTFSAAAGAIKTFYLQQLKARTDFTYDASSLMIWYTTEMYVIIIAGSLPTLRPLFQKTVYVFHSYTHRSSKGYHSHDHAAHELEPYRKKKHTDTSILQTTRQRNSDQDVLATNAEGITKTVDIVFACSPGAEEGKKWEPWEEQHFGERGTREDERV
ncbi:MAG: hypothetical protein L6R36_000671 [Xanthoria steineri]|nr:MAG: hypothetical protein L6R36_000671 [Xanthoria steineri]